MSETRDSRRLSEIQTLWTVVGRAHGEGPAQGVSEARDELLARYGRVVHRYLLGALRDADAADELSQEFALRFARGDLRGADPDRGRFRDFLKGVLFHLIGDYHRRRKKEPLPLASSFDPAAGRAPVESDQEFVAAWRSELLNRAWSALEEHERQTGQPWHAVLRFRAQHAELNSEQMAEQLGARLGKPLTSAAVRQTLHRAREKFADILVDEVVQTLTDPTVEDLEQELIDAGLHEYCRPALDRIRRALQIAPPLSKGGQGG